MAKKKKVSVTIDRVVLANIERISEEKGISRSSAIEWMLKEWEKIYLREELKAGYGAMSGEDRKTAEESLEIVREVIGE